MESAEKEIKKKKKSGKSTKMLLALMGVGLLVMLYPVLSNLYNQLTGSFAIQEFNETIEERTEKELEEQRQMAMIYNEYLLSDGSVKECPYEYEDILDFSNGMMGYMDIPVIDVYLPIYHGVTEDVLSKGVGHMAKTAFPIGGEGNHSVLTGHTGSPSAHLFTDLDKMEMGDRFYVHIMDDTLAYEVDQILVVLPEKVDDIMPEAGMDFCTLVTCTPYGINSHRLLVRGHRVEYVAEDLMGAGMNMPLVIIAAIMVVAGIVTTVIVLRTRKKKNTEAVTSTLEKNDTKS